MTRSRDLNVGSNRWIAAAVAERYGLKLEQLANRSTHQGSHGTRALALARAAAAWALHELAGESNGQIGRVLGLAVSSARQAVRRAPKTVGELELARIRRDLRLKIYRRPSP